MATTVGNCTWLEKFVKAWGPTLAGMAWLAAVLLLLGAVACAGESGGPKATAGAKQDPTQTVVAPKSETRGPVEVPGADPETAPVANPNTASNAVPGSAPGAQHDTASAVEVGTEQAADPKAESDVAHDAPPVSAHDEPEATPAHPEIAPEASPEASLEAPLEAHDQEPAPDASSWVNAFGVDVLRALLADTQEPNVLISPLSLATALAMAGQGADGVTAEAFGRVLGYGDDAVRAGRALADLNDDLVRVRQDMTLRQANGLWLAGDLTLQPQFAADQDALFKAVVESVDFEDPRTVEAINAWFAEQTADMIPRLLDRLGPDTRIVLGNALYLKGRWLHSFDPERTEEAPFHTPGGETPVAMMHLDKTTLAYREDGSAQSVLLPFADTDYELAVILPRPGVSVNDLLAANAPDKTPAFLSMNGFRPQPGILALPRLDLHLGGDLTALLTGLGLFEGQNFSRMAQEPLVLDQVVHKVAFTVDEAGAEAAAATAVSMARSTMPLKPFEMTVNRPFLTALRHAPSNTLLFVGWVGKP